jgi:hypothetical protein
MGVISITIFICISPVATASSLYMSSLGTSSSKRSPIEISETTKTITIYRYGLNGSVIPLQIEITQKEGQNLGEILVNKCCDLLESDRELQKFCQDYTNVNNTLLAKVTSQGKGLHVKTTIHINLIRLAKFLPYLKLVKLFPWYPPFYSVRTNIPLIYCRYPRDANATTSITRILGEKNETINVQGNHSLCAIGFVGFTSWFNRRSFSPFDIIPRAFAGYTLLIYYTELT